MTNIDFGSLYGAARQRITAIVTAPDVDVETVVPSTPAWRVRDVVAHLAGISTDAMTGNMEGAPGEVWTAAQVERGRDRPLSDVLDDWVAYGEKFEEFLSSPAGSAATAAVVDAYTHEADIRHALGLPFEVPSDFLSWATGHLDERFHTAVAEAGLPPVSVRAADAELFRARLGRRTAAQVCAYEWSADPTPYLDSFFIFGPTEQASGEHL